jgi:hypothetical protein
LTLALVSKGKLAIIARFAVFLRRGFRVAQGPFFFRFWLSFGNCVAGDRIFFFEGFYFNLNRKNNVDDLDPKVVSINSLF